MKQLEASVRIVSGAKNTFFFSIFIFGLTTWNECYQSYTSPKGATIAAAKFCKKLNLEYSFEYEIGR